MWELDLPLVHNSKWNFTFVLFAFSIVEAMHKIRLWLIWIRPSNNWGNQESSETLGGDVSPVLILRDSQERCLRLAGGLCSGV